MKNSMRHFSGTRVPSGIVSPEDQSMSNHSDSEIFQGHPLRIPLKKLCEHLGPSNKHY